MQGLSYDQRVYTVFGIDIGIFTKKKRSWETPNYESRGGSSDFWLPTSDLTPLSGSIAARSASRVLMLKVKAQYKERLYRSSHKREQLKLLS